MATCKDCVHFDVCGNIVDRYYNGEDICNFTEADCKHFKDKSKILELPCKAGDAVYVIKYCRCNRPQNAEKQQCHHKEIPTTPKCYARLKIKQYRQSRVWDSWGIKKDGFESVAIGTICYKVHKKPFKLDWITQIGKTVFLTKEEAEKALEGLENGKG